jgi:hypothetical protein
MSRIDAALGYRFTAHTQLKLQDLLELEWVNLSGKAALEALLTA